MIPWLVNNCCALALALNSTGKVIKAKTEDAPKRMTPTHGYAATREEAGAQPRRRSICFGNFLCERAIGCDPLRGCHNH